MEVAGAVAAIVTPDGLYDSCVTPMTGKCTANYFMRMNSTTNAWQRLAEGAVSRLACTIQGETV